MPRNRMVKADFWVNEQLVACSHNSRLLFIGLWCFCDDAGIHPASYLRLKMEVFPGDLCSPEDIKKWINELITHGLVREYTVDNDLYWIVEKWKDYQKIDKPTYKYPRPESDFKRINDSNITHLVLEDNSTNTSRMVEEEPHSAPLVLDTNERKGKEKKGKEKDIREVKTSLGANPEVLVFNHWQKVMVHPHAKFDHKRRKKVQQALDLGYSIDQLKQAIDGCAKTPHNMGINDRNERYDDLELILRDASHIDRFIANEIKPPISNPKTNQKAQKDPMQGAIY